MVGQMERQAKDGTVYQQVGQDEWTPVTRTAKDGTVYKKMGEDAWSPLEIKEVKHPGKIESAARATAQGGTGGFADEIYGTAKAVGDDLSKLVSGDGPAKIVKRDQFGRITNLDEINSDSTYKKHRDEYRAGDEAARKANPLIFGGFEIASGVFSPINKVTKGMSAAKSGMTLGGLYGLGNSQSEDAKGMVIDTATGAAIGGTLGKGIDKASPYIEKGAQKVGQKVNETVQPIKKAVGEKLKDTAERFAFKSTGAMLKDWRTADAKNEVNKIGRWMLDRGIIKVGSTVDDVAANAAKVKGQAAVLLDEIYNKSGEALKNSGKGFDPLRDKERIMQAAKDELGDTVGGDAVLNQLSSYLDDLAAKHGDKPNQAVQNQFKRDVKRYKHSFKNYLKEKRAHNKAFGKASDDEQQMLQGFHDDSQRTVTQQRQIEVEGKPASQMAPEGSEFGTQMDLLEMPTGNSEAERLFAKPGDANFGHLGGDAADRLGKKAVDALEGPAQIDFLNSNTNRLMTNSSNQGEILGTELVPRTIKQVDDVGVEAGTGQLRMDFQPNAPTRPVRPSEVRNPMSPRRSNEIKGAFDEKINYSRNPLNNEPVTEKVYSGARREMNNVILESIDSIDDKVLGDALRGANSDYGTASKIGKIAKDRTNRENANKFLGLTDNITGTGSVVASILTGNPLTGLAMIGAKKIGEKYGASTTAVALDALSKRLLREPKMQQLAKVNPEKFNAVVIRMFENLDARQQLRLPKVAENQQASKPTKGPEKWANDGIEMIMQADQAGIDRSTLEKLKTTQKGKELLFEASTAKNKKAMENVIRKIRTATNGVE